MAKEKSWRDTAISFRYKDKQFSVKIEGNLVLNDMSVTEIKDRLNDLPGKFGHWKSMQVTAIRELEAMQERFEIWNAGLYTDTRESLMEGGYTPSKPPTEAAIKNRILMDKPDEYIKRNTAMRALQTVVDQLGVITKAYDMQLWALLKIGALTESEMNKIEPRVHGRGNLKDV